MKTMSFMKLGAASCRLSEGGRFRRVLRLGAAACAALGAGFLLAGEAPSAPDLRSLVVLNDDGGWCWFQDERAVICKGRLVVGSVAAGRFEPSRRGDIEAVVYDLQTGAKTRCLLHDHLQLDDHDSPVFLLRGDGRLLALYAKHGPENRFYYRVSEAGGFARWGPERTYSPSRSTRLTYSNLMRLADEGGRIYDFFRGLDGKWKPSYVYSDDDGETWRKGGIVIQSPAARPYVRYVSDGRATIHFLFTEGHPRDYDNSLYHMVYRGGMLRRSDGAPIAPLSKGLSRPDLATRIFRGDPDHVAWGVDIELDVKGRPCAVYSVQVGSAGLPPGQGGDDLRYRYARWDGSRWRDYPLAHAGTRLYAGEDDYSGLAAIDPRDVNTVFISTNADPVNGKPLISLADGRRHYEIFQGRTEDGGKSWRWTPVTRDSVVDNLRPIIPKPEGGSTVLLWLRGKYRAYTRYEQEAVMLPLPSR